MKLLKVVLLLLVCFLVFTVPAYAQNGPFPETPQMWFQMVGVLVVGIVIGVTSYLVQRLAQYVIPFLGQEQADKLVSGLNTLIALLLPVGVGYGLAWIAAKTGVEFANTWEFVVAIGVGLVASQASYEVRARRVVVPKNK